MTQEQAAKIVDLIRFRDDYQRRIDRISKCFEDYNGKEGVVTIKIGSLGNVCEVSVDGLISFLSNEVNKLCVDVDAINAEIKSL